MPRKARSIPAPSNIGRLDDLEAVNTPTIEKTEAESLADHEPPVEAVVATVTTKTSRKRKAASETATYEEVTEETEVAVKTKKPRTKKTPIEDIEPIRARATGLKMLVGAHVSMAGGVQNALYNSRQIGGNALALFLKSQRKWSSPPLKKEDVASFKSQCEKMGYDPMRHILPHGSYLINLAQPDPEKHKQAYDSFIDDLGRCEELKIGLYNFHPGSTLGQPRDEAIANIAVALNKAHASTKFTKTVLENMAGHGNIIGSAFEDLRDIIAQVTDKSRVGVCIDTCHSFAAGYDLRTQEAYDETMAKFEEVVGFEYLSSMHINDSKAPFAAKRDLHQNIGKGFLGLEAFRVLMNDSRLEGIPLVLETPNDDKPEIWAEEVRLLESLIGKAADDAEFCEQRDRLAKEGEKEREKALAAVEKKAEKEAKKGTRKPRAKGKTKKKKDTESEASD